MVNFLVPGGGNPAFLTAKLAKMSDWAAGGFVLLTGVLTYLGVEDGYLDRIIAENNKAAVWVFVALGLGVVTSLIAASTNPAVTVYSTWVIAALIGLGIATYLIVPDFDGDASPTKTAWAALAAAVGLGVFSFTKRAQWGLALPAALLIIAVAATSCGLYAAVKVSVASKALPEELKYTRTISDLDGIPTFQVGLSGTQQLYAMGLVQLSGRVMGEDADRVIGSVTYSPDATNTVSETLPFPLPFKPWTSLTFSQCEIQARKDPECKPTKRGTFSPDPSMFAASVSAILKPRPKRVVAMATVKGLPPSLYLDVRLSRRVRGTVTDTLRVQLSPNEAGTARWSTALPADKPARWILDVKTCGSQGCRSDLARTASLRVS